MTTSKRIVAFVPIRLNSKRVVGKNLKSLGNKPLLQYLLETLTSIKELTHIYVYSSSDEILPYLPKGVEWLQRPSALDSDTTLGKDIYQNFIDTIDADIYLLAHVTSPFLKATTIQKALKKVTESTEYDSAFSALEHKTFAWYNNTPLNYSLKNIPLTQNITPVYTETSGFYIFKKEVWIELKQRIGTNPYITKVDGIEGLDIDYPEDFELAQQMIHILD